MRTVLLTGKIRLAYRLMAKCSCLMLQDEERTTATSTTLYVFRGFVSEVNI